MFNTLIRFGSGKIKKWKLYDEQIILKKIGILFHQEEAVRLIIQKIKEEPNGPAGQWGARREETARNSKPSAEQSGGGPPFLVFLLVVAFFCEIRSARQ
jgi:hypothetical protein